MVAADRLHATLDLSLPIHLRGRHPLVELALFHQKLSRRHLTHFRYLHRVLNHHRTNIYVRQCFLTQENLGATRGYRVRFFYSFSFYFFFSKAREYNALVKDFRLLRNCLSLFAIILFIGRFVNIKYINVKKFKDYPNYLNLVNLSLIFL